MRIAFGANLAHLWPEPGAMMATFRASRLAHLWPRRQGEPVRMRLHGTVWDGALRIDFFKLSTDERKFTAA